MYVDDDGNDGDDGDDGDGDSNGDGNGDDNSNGNDAAAATDGNNVNEDESGNSRMTIRRWQLDNNKGTTTMR
jgi:hypothetical protein